MKKLLKNEAGAVLLTVALFLLLLLGFMAIGVEAGRWYLVRAELSKSVDAGALAGARNLSNPLVDTKTLAHDFTTENFPGGALGTPNSGTGTATFNIQTMDEGKVQVDGSASAVAIFARMFGFDKVPVASSGMAQMREVEIMMILDRSGSMAGQPFSDLKVAAKSFLDFFQDTQDKDKVGLISFATSVKVDRPLGTNFVTAMKTAITAMSATGYTNPEDALDQADGPSGFTDQSGIAPESRVQQFAIFFSDGRPNTIRDTFKNRNAIYDATVTSDGNCDPGASQPVLQNLGRPDREGNLVVGGVTIIARPTGDGVYPASKCGFNRNTTRWNIWNVHPIPGYGPDPCSVPSTTLGNYLCNLAAYLAVQRAGELKAKGVIVYSIGLGERINTDFLEAIATSSQQVYVAPTSDQLKAIFQKVAQDIKLRLVS